MGERQEVGAAKVREWARRNGIPVGARGRIPPSVVNRFNRVHRYYVYRGWDPNEAKRQKAQERIEEQGNGQVQEG